MAKTNKDRDRRAVVEQLRRDQKKAEKRRSYVVVAVCVVIGLVIIGAAAVPLLKQNKLTKGALAEIGVSKSDAGCQSIVKKKATGNQEHKPEGTSISYTDAPPAFGAHYPVTAPFARKFYTADDRPQIEYVVHNLEHGYNLLWYDDTIAKNSDELATVKAIATKFEGQKLTDKFIALPWKATDGKPFPKGTHVVMTHWSADKDPSDPSKQQGIWEYCAKPSGEVVSDFVKQYPYTDSPEPQAM